MKITSIRYLMLLLLLGCYKAPEIQDFDMQKWRNAIERCESYRIADGLSLLLENEQKLLTTNQNEIVSLLGNPERHELFDRNQKFFYYQLDCKKSRELSIRFDALGRVRVVQVVFVQ